MSAGPADLTPPAPLPLKEGGGKPVDGWPPPAKSRQEESPLSRGRIASTLLFLIAFLALLAQFAVYVDYAAALFRFPYDYDQGEGFELYDTVLH